MAPSTPRLRILSVGGNAVSAFLSWRLQATNACDVTLVWKSGYDAVAQYGISFKSKLFGNERFKPRHVVRAPEDASSREAAFDYVLLCVKALPDVYDLAAVIESVVTPQHTCILVNTSHTLGVEPHLEQRFPTNVVLSLVSGAEITQLGASEFEHAGSTEVWVGPANKNIAIPASIQNDMAEALAMTLGTGQVDCKVSENIRQQQYERMIGPIAFHPASVLFETPSHTDLFAKVGVRQMVSDTIDELITVANLQGCSFPSDFKEQIIESMLMPSPVQSIMYQDFMAKRPMEVETYLGTPIKLAVEFGVAIPRIETLYAILHHLNIVNQTRQSPPSASPTAPQGPVRLSSAPQPRHLTNGPTNGPMNGPTNGSMNGPMNGPMNGNMRGRGPPGMGMPPPRRGPMMNGYPPRGPNGYPPRGPNQMVRRPSLEGEDLEEFSHVVLYDDIPEGGATAGGVYPDMANGGASSSDLALRERELMLRQRELQLKEQEIQMRRGGRRGPRRSGFDDDDEDDYFYATEGRGPPVPHIDAENFDMMSVTSRRTRKAPSASQLRKNPEGSNGIRPNSSFGRPFLARNRTSTRLMQDVPGLHDSLLDNPMMGYSSNRYANVDRKEMADESRANSLTASRLNELGQNGFPPPNRRTSQSPGNPFPPSNGPTGRPSPPNGPNGSYIQPRGRPSPPGLMRAPVPRHPPGQGNAVAPQQVEQYAGVSNSYPPKAPLPNVRSLTGSASASAGSGDSANIDSENSAHSSQSSLGPRQALGVGVR